MIPSVILIKKSIIIFFLKKNPLNPVFKKAQDMKFMHIEFYFFH